MRRPRVDLQLPVRSKVVVLVWRNEIPQRNGIQSNQTETPPAHHNDANELREQNKQSQWACKQHHIRRPFSRERLFPTRFSLASDLEFPPCICFVQSSLNRRCVWQRSVLVCRFSSFIFCVWLTYNSLSRPRLFDLINIYGYCVEPGGLSVEIDADNCFRA